MAVEIQRFDRFAYFDEALSKNKLAASLGFQFFKVTGITGLDAAINGMRDTSYFFCVDDSEDVVLSAPIECTEKKLCSVFLIARFDLTDPDDRIVKMSACRDLFMQLVTKLVSEYDRLRWKSLCFLNLSQVMFKEFENLPLNGCTGGFFTFDYNQPVDLTYHEEDWV